MQPVTLRPNNCTVRETCPTCGTSHKSADTPYWLFTGDGALCWKCADELAPLEAGMARLLNARHWATVRGPARP